MRLREGPGASEEPNSPPERGPPKARSKPSDQRAQWNKLLEAELIVNPVPFEDLPKDTKGYVKKLDLPRKPRLDVSSNTTTTSSTS